MGIDVDWEPGAALKECYLSAMEDRSKWRGKLTVEQIDERLWDETASCFLRRYYEAITFASRAKQRAAKAQAARTGSAQDVE